MDYRKRFARVIESLSRSYPVLLEAGKGGELTFLQSFLRPAANGLLIKSYEGQASTELSVIQNVSFDWSYRLSDEAITRLYEEAKNKQWNSTHDLDWSVNVDPDDPGVDLVPDSLHPLSNLRFWARLSAKERREHKLALISWLLSQFLHGEQGALFAASRITQSVPYLDAKLLGSTQVMDEARHVEAFERYLRTKLEKRYEINENLYTIIEALMRDPRWDIQFLGMQILIEGLALGTLGTLYQLTREPLLKSVLRYVTADESRHVRFGVTALRQFYRQDLTEKERREREEWALMVSLLMRSRFLAYELFDELYAPLMTRRAWETLIQRSSLMAVFQKSLSRSIVPSLKATGLLSTRVRPRYEKHGLLSQENARPPHESSVDELLS